MASSSPEPRRRRTRKTPRSPAPQSAKHAEAARSADSRECILDAAERLFQQRGYAATGIAAVCKQSGLPASSIYWHFGSKAGLLGAVLDRGQTKLMNEMGNALGSDLRIERAIELAFDAMQTERTDFIRLLMQIGLERAPQDPALADMILQIRERALAFHVSMLGRRFEADGVPRAGELAERCARVALTFAQGSILSHRLSPETADPRQSARDLLAVIEALRAGHELDSDPTRSRHRSSAPRPKRNRS